MEQNNIVVGGSNNIVVDRIVEEEDIIKFDVVDVEDDITKLPKDYKSVERVKRAQELCDLGFKFALQETCTAYIAKRSSWLCYGASVFLNFNNGATFLHLAKRELEIGRKALASIGSKKADLLLLPGKIKKLEKSTGNPDSAAEIEELKTKAERLSTEIGEKEEEAKVVLIIILLFFSQCI